MPHSYSRFPYRIPRLSPCPDPSGPNPRLEHWHTGGLALPAVASNHKLRATQTRFVKLAGDSLGILSWVVHLSE